MNKIKKRDGKIVPFNGEKITEAIYKAAKAVAEREGKEPDRGKAENVSARVVGNLEQMFGDITTPTVEQVQDIVERTLMDLGFTDTAKTYILYRQSHKEQRQLNAASREVFDFARRIINGYIGGDDWRIKENSSSGHITFQGGNARLAGDLWNTFALNEMYGKENPEIADAHLSGQMHIHDLDFPIVAYCCGHSLKQLLERGFGEVKERVQSSPPKHLRSAISQMVNYIGTMQGEFAGAQAFSSVDSYLAPFVKADNLDYKEVKQSMQELIYGLNVPSRWGWQAPFSNLTFDLTVPDDLNNEKATVGGKKQDFTLGDCQKEVDIINMAYLEVKRDGDKSGRIFTFPLDTYNISKDFKWDSEISELLFEVTGKYGIPYFQNYVGSGLDPGAIRAMCCRLNLDQRELMKRPGSLWGPGDSTGSIGVVTINMNRIGYEAKNDDEFFRFLGHRMDLAKQSLEIKRKTIETLLKQDFVPFTKSYLGHFTNHFSTIGLIGMHESLMNFTGKGIETEKGKEFAIKTLNFMRGKLVEYQEETGNLYNLEATPGEGASYRLAKLDKENYSQIYTSGKDEPFLTNSTQLPVSLDIDLFSALKHQESLQTLYTGGTIFHTFLGERISGNSAKNLVKKIAYNTQLPYFSLTPVFSVCEDHGYLNGIVKSCPSCGKEPEVYDRIVGYIRPVNNWNKGKQEEFKYRKRFEVPSGV
ncbi:MAG: ribonucleoside triphosphate reductase [Nanoarchaeota archaeon]|nr:ribonucleoside triphosphate reductase [Nanoarchaeota archaeon]